MSERLDFELRHELRRCPKLNDAEMRFLAFIAAYSQGCLLSYDKICALTNWSRSKLKRVIADLLSKNLITVEYRAYKKTKIKIVPAAQQCAFARGYGSPVSHKSWLTSEPMMAHPWTHDGSPVSHSMLERELERKLETDFYFVEKEENLKPVVMSDWLRKMSERVIEKKPTASDQ